jgi:AAA15 family ATPase/GTPase
MLDSLKIKNYRNLKDFQIKSLSRVNLITGKNNTGKSTILEAIAIYASKGDMNVIKHLLFERGESFNNIKENKNQTESNVKALSSLFTNRIIGFKSIDAISIGSIQKDFINEESKYEEIIFIRFVKFIEELFKDNNGELMRRKRIALDTDIESQTGNYNIAIQISRGNDFFTLSLDQVIKDFYNFSLTLSNNKDNFQLISTRIIDREINGKLWDTITLTEKENNVIDALKIIEPLTERITFIDEGNGKRKAVIKVSNNSGVLPLLSMGDGINRILTIILALVNSDNGYLLIDEFENGLHHTVQEKLWNIIFYLSQKLNVQVFATTHSEDCISAFQKVLNNSNNIVSGMMIRLENDKGTIKEIEFNKDELKIADERGIEIR